MSLIGCEFGGGGGSARRRDIRERQKLSELSLIRFEIIL
jgi:hypothetical protein